MRNYEAVGDMAVEQLARELLEALIEGRPAAAVLQKADACIAWRGHRREGVGSEAEERGEVLAAVAASAQGRYQQGGSGMLPAEFTLLTHFLG